MEKNWKYCRFGNVTANMKDYAAGLAIAILQKRDSYNKSKEINNEFKKISVVVCVKNEEPRLEECLKRIKFK